MFKSDYYKDFFNSVLNIVFTKFRIFLKWLDKVEIQCQNKYQHHNNILFCSKGYNL